MHTIWLSNVIFKNFDGRVKAHTLLQYMRYQKARLEHKVIRLSFSSNTFTLGRMPIHFGTLLHTLVGDLAYHLLV